MVKELEPAGLLADLRGPVPLDLTMDAAHEILPRVQFRSYPYLRKYSNASLLSDRLSECLLHICSNI